MNEPTPTGASEVPKPTDIPEWKLEPLSGRDGYDTGVYEKGHGFVAFINTKWARDTESQKQKAYTELIRRAPTLLRENEELTKERDQLRAEVERLKEDAELAYAVREIVVTPTGVPPALMTNERVVDEIKSSHAELARLREENEKLQNKSDAESIDRTCYEVGLNKRIAELRAELSTLRARVAVCESDIEAAHRMLDEAGVVRSVGEKELTVAGRIDTLRARVKELEADGERLNELMWRNDIMVKVFRDGGEVVLKPYSTPTYPLRAAIDAALKGDGVAVITSRTVAADIGTAIIPPSGVQITWSDTEKGAK